MHRKVPTSVSLRTSGGAIIARSAIYVHRRSLLLMSYSSDYYYDRIPKVMGLIIIGETVACTLRVIFSSDFKVPKKPGKKVR